VLPQIFFPMTNPSPPDPLEQARVLDALCDAFEDACRLGKRPALEDFLLTVPPALHAGLLPELLRLDRDYRRTAGERPTRDEYARRFPQAAAALGVLFPEAAARMLVLEVIDGPHRGQRFTLPGAGHCTVGRSREAGFSLPEKDLYLSRLHFRIEFDPPVCRLVDQTSHNHTWVNGQLVSTAELHDGDEIQAGRTRFRVRLVAPSAV
jgi:hypothetical protein